jgi:hypothetical protein
MRLLTQKSNAINELHQLSCPGWVTLIVAEQGLPYSMRHLTFLISRGKILKKYKGVIAILVVVGCYFLFFFETAAMEKERLAVEEQERIEALGSWEFSARKTITNRALARNLGIELSEFTKKYGDQSQSKRELHFKNSSVLATVYQDPKHGLVMTVSYSEVEKLKSARAKVSLPYSESSARRSTDRILDPNSVSNRYFESFNDDDLSAEEKEKIELEYKLNYGLTSYTDYQCLGKVCFIELEPERLQILSLVDTFEVEFSGTHHGKFSGNEMYRSQTVEIPVAGLIENLETDINFESVDPDELIESYVCRKAKEFCKTE